MKFCEGLMSAGIGQRSIIVKYLKNIRYIRPLPPKVEHLIAIEKWTVEARDRMPFERNKYPQNTPSDRRVDISFTFSKKDLEKS